MILPARTEAQMWGSRPLPSLLYNQPLHPPHPTNRASPPPSLIFLFLSAHSTAFHLASLPFFSRLRFNVVVRRVFFPPTTPPAPPPTSSLWAHLYHLLWVSSSPLCCFFFPPSPATHRVVISLSSRYLSPSFLCRGDSGAASPSCR